jgi:hypothetical protein
MAHRTGWQARNQELQVYFGWFTFPRAMGDSDSVATITLKNYSTSKIGWATDSCWFDLFQGNHCCLRIAFHRTQRIVTFNQVVDNAWTDQIQFNFPADLVVGKEVALKISFEKGVFMIAFNDVGAHLAWGAPADSLGYRADHASHAIFRDWVPAEYRWNASIVDASGDIFH